jgi:hypothetical protein
MSDTPIFDQLLLESVTEGRYGRILIGPPEPHNVFGLPIRVPLHSTDETAIIEAVKVEEDEHDEEDKQTLPSILSGMDEALLSEAETPDVVEKQHVFPINRPKISVIKNSATKSFSFFGRAA